MIYLTEKDPVKWALAHGLPGDMTYQCPACGSDFRVDIPFVTKRSWGLSSAPHECGIKYVRTVCVPKDAELNERLIKALEERQE